MRETRAADGHPSPRQAIQEGRRFIWQVDRAAVSECGCSPVVAGQVRLGPVFTPPEQRGNGFASNLVAHVTAGVLEGGAVPTLVTDLANPASNRIYRSLGYQPVNDSHMVDFLPAP